MKKRMTWLLIFIAVVGAISWFGILSLRRASYPKATDMPLPPAEPLAEILQRLESQIKTHSPKRLASLRPGLSHEEVIKTESEYGLRLTDELRELYEWHDGISLESEASFFGIHQFLPLEHLARSRQAMGEGQASSTGLQRVVYAVTGKIGSNCFLTVLAMASFWTQRGIPRKVPCFTTSTRQVTINFTQHYLA